MAHRAGRLAQQFKQEISAIIARELQDPRVGFATITDVRVSPDLTTARVFVSVLGSPAQQQETVQALNQGAGFVRRLLSARIRLRRHPELTFVYDDSIEKGQRMMQIIEEIKKELPDE